MAETPAAKNSVHWAPSPILSPFSDSPSQSSSSFTSSSTIQYVNAQLISHGFAVSPGLSLDGLSTADAESVTKCLLSMLSQRVEDMTRAEELTTKLRTLSYDHERLRTMHSAATETAEGAEREAAASRAKLTIANRAQTQAETAHKQTTGDLQRARTALQALRATHVAEIKKREKEVEAMRERWSKLADAQLRVASLPSGMVLSRPAAANASVLPDGASGSAGAGQKGVVEGALEEAEKAGALLREENKELKGLVVDAVNAVRKILHKAVSSDPDDLEFPPPLAAIDLFPLGARDAAFERLSGLLTSLQDTLTTLRDSPSTADPAAASGPKAQILLADLAKKAAESDAKAHKWEVEELRNTIAGLRDELKKVKVEKKLAPMSRLQDIPVAHDKLVSYLPPTDEGEAGPALEPQHEMEVTDPEPSSKQEQEQLEQHSSKKREMLPSTRPEKSAPPPMAVAQPGPSRLSSPRKTRSKPKPKPVHKSPLKAARASKASSASAKRSSTRPRRLSSKRVEASFETEVIPSTVPASLLPTSFVLPPPSPESCLPPPRPSSPHPTSFLAGPSSVPPLLFPTTTPPFPPPVQHSTPFPPPLSAITTATETREMVVPGIPAAGADGFQSQIQNGHHLLQQPPQKSNPFPLAKPLGRNMSHAYSPVKPSPLSRILMLATSPESATVAAAEPQNDSIDMLALPPPAPLGGDPNPYLPPGTSALVSRTAPAPVFERPQLPQLLPPQPPRASLAPAPAPLRTDTTSNTGAGPQRRRKRTSLEAELDIDADTEARPSPKNNLDAGGRGAVSMDVVNSDTATAATVAATKDPRAPEKENTIRRRLRGPAAVRKANVNANANANVNVGRGGMKTRKMAAAAAAAATSKSESGKSESGVPKSALASVPVPAPAPAATAMTAVEAGRVGGAASRLLAAVHGGSGPRRVPIDSTEAAAGVLVRRAS